ncbi:hypothetical protein K7432_016616 [Basidiobolus ranarum]|uniref:Carrier domain-containing protein n=1 Tax=Basidiobolus ranarum TaxID=34480 RepID=A0ABR2WEI0_9FUNG
MTTRPSYNVYIDYLLSLNKDKMLDYWKNALSEVSATHLAGNHLVTGDTLMIGMVTERFQVDFGPLTTAHDLTIATIVNFAWALVLKFHTGSSDILFGSVNSGRNISLQNIQQICGPCINTLPTRILLKDEVTLLDSMMTIHKAQVEQLPHQSIGLSNIINGCGIKDIHSLFDTLLVIQNLSETTATDDLSAIGLENDQTTMPLEYPIVVELFTTDVDYKLTLKYNSNLISNDKASWILSHLRTAIIEIIEAPGILIKELSIISSDEAALVESWSDVNRDQPTPTCLHSIFEHVTTQYPENIAVQFETSEYVTYAELNRRANQLAHHLINLGVGPESMVPLCLDKSVFMIVAILAVLKAGGAYVPLDPNNPSTRNDFIMEETNARMVVTIAQYKQMFNDVALVLMDGDIESIERNSANNPFVSGLTESNLCYVLYTSGSTGTPKGVMIEHNSVVNLMYGLRGIWDLTTKDVALQFANYTFDASIIQIFPTLLSGACLALADRERLLTDLEYCIQMMDVTCLDLTTTIINSIVPQNVPSVKKVALGGEMMTSQVRNAWAPMVTLNNGYGPTEVTVAFLINPIVNEKTSCSNVGKPIGCNRIYILDSDMRPVPLGVCGELCVSGPQLARGYLNRPDLTMNAFLLSPFIPGERLYRTGDLARFNPDGSVELIGRKDNQIKLNGLRIELDEIEYALHENPAVARACVVSVNTDTDSSHKNLTAFISFYDLVESDPVTKLLNSSTTNEVGRYIEEAKCSLRKKLPPYMIPTIWIPLNNIPTTTSGKINRPYLLTFYKSLNEKELLSLGSGNGRGYVSPRTKEEECWVELWSGVLKVPKSKIGIYDSFFAHGGDSISAIRLVAAANKIGYSITVKDIYEYTSVAGISQTSTQIDTDQDIHQILEPFSLLHLDSDELDHLLNCDKH